MKATNRMKAKMILRKGKQDYYIEKLAGIVAIPHFDAGNPAFRVGLWISEQEADRLCEDANLSVEVLASKTK